MNARILVVLVILVTNFRLCQGKRYDNFNLYRVVPKENEHLVFLQNLEKQKYLDVVFWKKPYKLFEEVQFIISPKDLETLRERIRHYGVHVEHMNSNIQEAFDAQVVPQHNAVRTSTYTWTQYHSLDDVNQWLKDVAARFSEIVVLETIGRSSENREIYAISIKREEAKQTVIVEAGMHGNEWLSTEFVTYLIYQLLHVRHDSSPRLKRVARIYQWFIVPISNPDGYVYSHNDDRLWRKNRRVIGKNVGVDLNRNFDYNFGKFGTTNNSADDMYAGPAPFSEPETSVFSSFVAHRSKGLKFFFSFHSFGQKIIIPYSDRILHVSNYAEMENFAKQASIKIYRKYHNKYSVGTTYDTLGKRISGNSASWVKKTFDVQYVFTFLLRDNGTYGHALPPGQILEACEEALLGLLEIMTASPRRIRADMFSDNAVDVRMGQLLLCVLVFWMFK